MPGYVTETTNNVRIGQERSKDGNLVISVALLAEYWKLHTDPFPLENVRHIHQCVAIFHWFTAVEHLHLQHQTNKSESRQLKRNSTT